MLEAEKYGLKLTARGSAEAVECEWDDFISGVCPSNPVCHCVCNLFFGLFEICVFAT